MITLVMHPTIINLQISIKSMLLQSALLCICKHASEYKNRDNLWWIRDESKIYNRLKSACLQSKQGTGGPYPQNEGAHPLDNSNMYM